MHQRHAQFVALLCLVFTVGSVGYLGYSYLETRQRVILEESRVPDFPQRVETESPAAPTDRYVAPAPIIYPFY